jgi:CDP-diacylglycerol--serine O-phosphatidyltransferase
MQISFCVSPAVASIAIGMRTPLDHFLLTSFALCGLLRLARFNISTDSVPKDANGKAKYFEGLPTPTSLGIVALISYWVSQGWIHNQIPFGVIAQGSIFEFHPAALIFVAHGEEKKICDMMHRLYPEGVWSRVDHRISSLMRCKPETMSTH